MSPHQTKFNIPHNASRIFWPLRHRPHNLFFFFRSNSTLSLNINNILCTTTSLPKTLFFFFHFLRHSKHSICPTNHQISEEEPHCLSIIQECQLYSILNCKQAAHNSINSGSTLPQRQIPINWSLNVPHFSNQTTVSTQSMVANQSNVLPLGVLHLSKCNHKHFCFFFFQHFPLEHKII